MKITEVKIRKLIFNEKPMKAIVSIVIDDAIAIHDIKVIEKNGDQFVAFCSQKDKQGIYRNIVHPMNETARAEIEQAIFEAYKEAYDEYVITHADC